MQARINVYRFEEHLMRLLVEEKLARQEGDWDRVNYLSMCIDDTQDQINNAKKGNQ